jgi:hypothetical protein
MDRTVNVKRHNPDGTVVELTIPYETEEEKRRIIADFGFTVHSTTEPELKTRRGKRASATTQQVVEYLEKKGGNFEHAFPEIGRNLLGDDFRASSDNAQYIKLRAKILEAQKIIAEKYSGKWEKANSPDSKKVKVFRLVKN